MIDVLPARMVSAWAPLIGEDLAFERARQRLRQYVWFAGLLALQLVLYFVTLPPAPDVFGVPPTVVLLILSLAVSYALPMVALVTFRVGSRIARILAAQGIPVRRPIPLLSTRRFVRWRKDHGLGQEQLVRLLEGAVD